MNRNLLLGLIFVLCLVSFISPSLAWWNDSWQYRRNITIDNSGNSNDLTNYQILVVLNSSNFDFSKANSDGSDIRFIDSDDTTKLNYWIEEWNSTAQEAKIWVKVPSIPGSSTKTIYMYYGNSNAESESNFTSVFDNNLKGFYPLDSFYNANDVVNQYTSTIYGDTYLTTDQKGRANEAYQFDGNGDYIDMGDYYDIESWSAVSVCGWFNFTGFDGYVQYLFGFEKSSGSRYIVAGGFYDNADPDILKFYGEDSSGSQDAAEISFTPNYDWHFICLCFDGVDLEVYFDGTWYDVDDASLNGEIYNPEKLAIGRDIGDTDRDLIGRVSELRVYNKMLTTEEITQFYADPEPTTSVGSEEVLSVQIIIYSPENKTYYTTSIEVNVSTYAETSYTCNITNDGNLIGTANETSPNFTTTITNTGGSHNVSVKCITDSGYESNKTVNYYVWMGLNISVYYNDTGEPAQNWSLTITNGTATYTAENLSNPTMLEWDEIPYGTINVTVDDGSDTLYYFPNTTQVVNNESTYTILNLTLYLKPLNEITLTASPSWNVLEGQSVTISCSVSEGTPTLKVDNVIVSNPYTFTATVGSHSVVCSIGETDNYRPNEESKTLVVNPLVACTNNLTFAFSVTITTSTDITSLNFTKFVEMHYVKPDLSDVWVPNASEVWINTTNGYYLVVNTTNLSEFKVYFGNYFVNNSYSTHAVQNLKEIESYKQENIYAIYKLLDEVTGQENHPPNATLMAFVSCSYGSNYIFLEGNEIQYLIALKDYPIKTSVRVQYTADSYYSRVLYPSRKESYVLNFYLVDAYKYPLDRIDFIMRDTRYYNSRLQIYKEIANQTIIITEGYFDASHSISLYLMEDCDYYIRILNSDGTYTEFGIISVVEPTTKELGKTTISLNPQAISLSNYVTMNAWTNDDRTNLYIEYSDSLQNTSEVKIAIYFSNGTLFKEVTYYNTSSIDLTYDIDNYTDESFEVKFTIRHSNFGNQTYVMFLYPSGFWNLGISSLWYSLFAMGILIMLGGIATRRSIIGGVIVFMLGLVLFEIIGWLSLPLVAIGVIVLLGILAIMIYFKQGG